LKYLSVVTVYANAHAY